MSSSRSRPLVLLAALVTSPLAACGDRASGETQAAAKPARSSTSVCPTVEQVSAAAGFPLTFTQSIGSGPETGIICQYEMTGRYRGNFLELTGKPASGAESVFADLKRTAKMMKGQDTEADRVAIGSGGWAYGSNSRSEAAAVVGAHVYRAELEYMLASTIGDQKDAMVRVLELFAR